ncbi:MAG: hypothetical protein RLZZ453_1278 [Chlamydiota bacterium]|jgi:transcription-repair coupling factor (superfamily II helicase)
MAKTTLLLRLQKSRSLTSVVSSVVKDASILLDGVDNSGGKAALLALLAETADRTIVIIGSGDEDQLLSDLPAFTTLPLLEFPAWETLPGEEITPSPDLVGKRLEVLHALTNNQTPALIVTSLQSALQKLPPPQELSSLITTWKKGDRLSFQKVGQQLTDLGYTQVPVVSDKKQFAVRGGIIDLFPLSSPDPYRVEFFGDEIDAIRSFDPVSQKSTQKVEQFLLTPAFERPSDASLFDYLPKESVIVFNDLLKLEEHWICLKKLIKHNLLLSFEELFQKTLTYPRLFLAKESIDQLCPDHKKLEFAGVPLDVKRTSLPFTNIQEVFGYTKQEILDTLSSSAWKHLETHLLYLSEADKIDLTAHTHLAYLSSGFFLEEENLLILPTTAFSHRLKPRRQKWRNTYHSLASEFHELSIGDPVVHYHHGIAKYLGTEKKSNHTGAETEFLVLQYAENSLLYVPVAQSHLVSRYIGAHEETPMLSQLGSNRFAKTLSLAQTAITGYASDLIALYAERELKGGFAYSEDSEAMRLFENAFPFVETQDQLLAIAELKKEMQSDRAMDRLICGDVGYGKTEVAMRAAFKAVVDGKKQVAVLVPTTVLALQHSETFKARMENFPVRIGLISRFCSAKENRETLKKVKEGQIDILIGTHRILSQDVAFKDLGLLIIDEEQRFGVRAKEHLKKFKKGVDCLTLSATPIPRTLYLSLIGARAISTINTPPQDRLPIKSIIASKEAPLIKQALLRELARDGQAYFIHNRVDSIFKVTDEIQKLVPEARIVTGHGQMSADELDSVFHAFKQGDADILVATTIIENGIDIPNANTILIDRADTFGLSDLYQMRGRVGRWNRPAFAYFLVPALRELSEPTRKRLHAIAEASGFGGGMKVAMRDLEIRGAGDILGTSQSGQVSSIGFHLYCKLLKRAIDALKKGKSPSFIETKMEFSFNATLPEDYINEPSLRMEIYHRLGEATCKEDVDAILAELKDRFGKPPAAVLWLYHLTLLRLFASQRHFSLLRFDKYTLYIERQVKKTTLKKILPLKPFSDPAKLCAHVEGLLSEV